MSYQSKRKKILSLLMDAVSKRSSVEQSVCTWRERRKRIEDLKQAYNSSEATVLAHLKAKRVINKLAVSEEISLSELELDQLASEVVTLFDGIFQELALARMN